MSPYSRQLLQCSGSLSWQFVPVTIEVSQLLGLGVLARVHLRLIPSCVEESLIEPGSFLEGLVGCPGVFVLISSILLPLLPWMVLLLALALHVGNPAVDHINLSTVLLNFVNPPTNLVLFVLPDSWIDLTALGFDLASNEIIPIILDE